MAPSNLVDCSSYSYLFVVYKIKKLYAVEPKDAKEFRKKEAKVAKGLIKNTTDLIIPAARLGWLNVSDGIVGLAGTITSSKSYLANLNELDSYRYYGYISQN